MEKSKLIAYLGFAIKSGKVIFGYDKLFETKKNPNLVLICSSLNEKNTDKILKFCEDKKIKVIKLEQLLLGDLINRDNCKVLAIADLNFATVICRELEM